MAPGKPSRSHQQPTVAPTPRRSSGKESANAGDARNVGLIPGSGRWNRKWQPTLQYSCLENSLDRGAWRAIVHGITKSQT